MFIREWCLFSNLSKLNKNNMLWVKIWREFINSRISSPSSDMSRPSRNPYFSSSSQIWCQNIQSILKDPVVGGQKWRVMQSFGYNLYIFISFLWLRKIVHFLASIFCLISPHTTTDLMCSYIAWSISASFKELTTHQNNNNDNDTDNDNDNNK